MGLGKTNEKVGTYPLKPGTYPLLKLTCYTRRNYEAKKSGYGFPEV
jgi:hypothetical protein